jgi:surfeit locus 1 family protein
VTLLRPRWVAGHLLVLVLSASFVALGFWQLARNHHKQTLVREARTAYAAPAPDVSANDIQTGGRVQASGRYDPSHDIVLRNRVHNGKDGHDILTPLVLADGSAVMVDRGWVGTAATGTVDTQRGPVVVRGLARASSPLSTQDAVTTTAGELSLPRVDLTRIAQGLPKRLQPIWIEAQSQSPPPSAAAPALPEPPPPDQVNHMQYAIEWFSFAAIGIIGWPIALVAFARRRGGFRTSS